VSDQGLPVNVLNGGDFDSKLKSLRKEAYSATDESYIAQEKGILT
jgi:hypothetical protein